MHAHRITRSIVLALCSLPAITLIAASSDPAITRLWFPRPDNPTSRDVFDAFESTSGPNASKSAAKNAAKIGGDPLNVNAAPAIYPLEFRTIDGRNNAPQDLGKAGTVDLRNTTVGYDDGSGTPAGADRLGARVISNAVNKIDDPGIVDTSGISSFVFAWANIVDHDMTLLKVASPPEEFDIPVPTCDQPFDPRCLGGRVLHFQRSNSTMIDNIRQQIDANSAFLDASVIYGSDLSRSQVIRPNPLDGTGHLLSSDGSLLPLNLNGITNQPERAPDPTIFFLAGDVRANENTSVTALQTLFMREHNQWADTFAGQGLSDDDIYQRARAIVCAEIQLITYRDFIPILLGPNALTPWVGYNKTVDPRVSVVFATAAFRMGHTMVPPDIILVNKQNVTILDLPLSQTIFAPQLITKSGIDPFLRGLARQEPQVLDGYVINGVRSFQVGGTKPIGFDLAALDI